MTEPAVALASITMECADAGVLADFYRELLGLVEEYADDERTSIALRGKGYLLSCVRTEGYARPSWPGTGQQMHLDLYASDVDAAVERAVALGATVADYQPDPTMWRVLIDPAGHPFCLMKPFD